MIRWSYVVPRLMIVAALLLALGLGLDPLLRWLLIAGGQSVTGARVEMGEVATSLTSSQVSITRVQVANPYAPDTNLVEAKHAWVDLETGPLTRKRFIIHEGVVSGLKINAQRDETGLLDPSAPSDEEFGLAAKEWLADAALAMGKNLEDELETVQLAHEMKHRWPEEYKELEDRIDAWLADVKALEQLPDQLQGDVLQQAEQIRRASLTLRALKDELRALRGEFQRLHQQQRVDRAALADAAERDIQRIKQRIAMAKLEPEALTDYFLGPELGPQARDTVAWVQSARRQIPSSEVPEPQRGRGVDIHFASYHPEPWLLARNLRADGEVHWRGRAIPFTAMAHDWTAEPKLHGVPAKIRIKTTTPVESWIELTVDRTAEQPIDRLTYICPHYPLPEQSWGDDDYLTLKVPAGSVHVQAAFALVNEDVVGTIHLHRDDLAAQLALHEELGGAELAGRVQRHLDNVQTLDAEIAITGTVTRPTTSIRSGLGGQLRDALRAAVADEIAVRRKDLEADVQTTIREEIDSLQQQLAVKKSAVMKKLDLADKQQQLVERLVARSIGAPKQALGRRLLDALNRR